MELKNAVEGDAAPVKNNNDNDDYNDSNNSNNRNNKYSTFIVIDRVSVTFFQILY